VKVLGHAITFLVKLYEQQLTALNYIGTEASKVICYIAAMTYGLTKCTTYM